MEIEKELSNAYRKSTEYLESLSALEFMNDSELFMRDLSKLVGSQRLPANVLIGCLMSEICMLEAASSGMLLDVRLEKVFRSFKKYVDEKFIKKE